jgi:hypothetical protein
MNERAIKMNERAIKMREIDNRYMVVNATPALP